MIAIIAAWLIMCCVVSLLIIKENNGKFIYSLDDPYIHMAVSEQLINGGYGINSSEISSPSSSIIWPFILAPFAKSKPFEFAPLVLNVIFLSLAICIVLNRLYQICSNHQSEVLSKLQLTAIALFVVSIFISCNAIGICFTGMEHGLQFLTATIAIDALILAFASGQTISNWKSWHYIGIVLGPLVRFENASLTAAIIVALLCVREWKKIFFICGCTVVPIALFSGFLHSNGLPLLPCSILLKSSLSAGESGGNFIKHFYYHALWLTEESNRGLTLLLLALVLISIFFAVKERGLKIFLIAVLTAATCHLLVGSYGWNHRYEPYIIGSVVYAIIALLLNKNFTKHYKSILPLSINVLLACSVLSFPYIDNAIRIHKSTYPIYLQQFQFANFVKEEWKKPVAVNDLGLVSYRNDNYVLDLWGLGSYAALQHRKESKGVEWMTDLMEQNDVELAILYTDWFPEQPDNWVKVAEMRLPKDTWKAYVGSDTVSFFARDPSMAQGIRESLLDYKPKLPKKVILEMQ